MAKNVQKENLVDVLCMPIVYAEEPEEEQFVVNMNYNFKNWAGAMAPKLTTLAARP